VFGPVKAVLEGAAAAVGVHTLEARGAVRLGAGGKAVERLPSHWQG